ncbi:hypothetical protein Cni_G13157 [Canna indica]|uniref:Uncharacterized protein n=1 Tax=Canna indica TaxID=4628 RepID=A0AAQ3KF07_9LILI|nr:hypothetical protein Cni_G13157 [Canna indica]
MSMPHLISFPLGTCSIHQPMLHSMEFDWPAPEEPTSDAAWLLSTRAMGRPRNDVLLRQTYLRSYQFTVKERFRDRLRRNLKEAGELGWAIVSEIADRVFDARLEGVKTFRYFGSKVQAAAMSPLRCFVVRKKCYLED